MPGLLVAPFSPNGANSCPDNSLGDALSYDGVAADDGVMGDDDVIAADDDVRFYDYFGVEADGRHQGVVRPLKLSVTHSDYALPSSTADDVGANGKVDGGGSQPSLDVRRVLFAARRLLTTTPSARTATTTAAPSFNCVASASAAAEVPRVDGDADVVAVTSALLTSAAPDATPDVGGAPTARKPTSAATTPNCVKFEQPTPPNSMADMSSTAYLSGSKDDAANASSSNVHDSCSAKDHHAAVRNKYSRTRKRHFTDPVDFEGILRIIGGCGWWQLWIYFFVSLQQIPHAMFNLSVIYMMFKPDHWCYQEWLDPSKHDRFTGWTNEQIRNFTAPLEFDPVLKVHKYSQCMMYDRGQDHYHDLSHMSFENATLMADHNVKAYFKVSRRACDKWTFDKSVMEETIVSQWNLVCGISFHRADAQLAYALGYFIGCLVSGLSSDRFGRKPTVIAFGVLASTFGIILPYSTYFPMFLLIRFLSAVCNEAADLAAYVLCMEITGTKFRSCVGSLLQLPWAIGYTLLALVAYLTRSWRTIQLITAGVHTLTIVFICVLPESPRWLIVNNRVREAEGLIRKACRMNHSELPADLELVKHAEQRRWVKRDERANFLHVFKSYELFLRTTVIFIVWIATALVYYGISLNLSDQSAPGGKLFSGNFFVNNAVAGAVEIPTLIACCYFLKYGRKRCLMVTLILAGLMMLGVVISPDLGYFRLIFMLLGKMFIQAAFNILYIFTSELYPTVIRNSAVGTCSMVARMGAGVTGYLAILSDITLPIVPMIIFGVFSLVAGTLVVFLPETQDQPLPETLQDAVIFLKPDKNTYCNLTGLMNGGGSGTGGRGHKSSESEYTPANPQPSGNDD